MSVSSKDSWDAYKMRTVKFTHKDCGTQQFEGMVRSTTVGRVLLDIPDNPGCRYVWFLKSDISIVK